MKTTRKNFDFDKSTVTKINHLKRKTNASSHSEVIRRAISLYEIVTDEQNNWGEIIFRRKGKETALKFLF